MDASATRSGAVRCVGPFSRNERPMRADQVVSLMVDLTNRIELEALDASEYVAWGTFRRNAPDSTHQLPLLGSDFFFTPNIALRSEILDLSPVTSPQHSISREWTISESDRKVWHRSVCEFEVSHSIQRIHATIHVREGRAGLDKALFHPATAKEMLSCLMRRALRLLGIKSLLHSARLSPSLAALCGALDYGSHTEPSTRSAR